MLIPLIQPRKLILIAGSNEETTNLAADCTKLLSAHSGASEEKAVDVLTPSVGVSVDASVDTNAWVVKLADPLVKRLKWQNVRGLGIVTITGLLKGSQPVTVGGQAAKQPHEPIEEETANKRLKTDAGIPSVSSTAGAAEEPTDVVPTLDVLPVALTSASRSAAQPLHVGDLRLADLRRAMQSAGHTAEFRGEGTLLIDGLVAVRKSAAGRIELESVGLPGTDGGPGGLIGGTFYAVRRMIYDGLAVVAGA
jgi:cleavage and polyadenylation specificity factor subunit 2